MSEPHVADLLHQRERLEAENLRLHAAELQAAEMLRVRILELSPDLSPGLLSALSLTDLAVLARSLEERRLSLSQEDVVLLERLVLSSPGVHDWLERLEGIFAVVRAGARLPVPGVEETQVWYPEPGHRSGETRRFA